MECPDRIWPTDDSVESTQTHGSVQARPARAFGDRLGPAVSLATTELFKLQPAGAATVSEANGRASIYLAALSSNLIALAFIGQMARLGTAFYAFALILLPVLAFRTVVTFQRLVQSSIEDIAYARRVARLRAFHVGLAPELETIPARGSRPTCRASVARARRRPSAWQLTLPMASMVAVRNRVLNGACAGRVAETLRDGSLAVPLRREQSRARRPCRYNSAATPGRQSTPTHQNASTRPRPSSLAPQHDKP